MAASDETNEFWEPAIDPVTGMLYRPGTIIARGDDARRFVENWLERQGEDASLERLTVSGDEEVWRFTGVGAAVQIVRLGRADGLDVQLDTAFFAHSCGCGCCGAQANPLWANPLWANPLWANPLWANSIKAEPLWANPLWANGLPDNTAVPAEEPSELPVEPSPVDEPAAVWILDSGMAVDRPPIVDDIIPDPADEDHPDELPEGAVDSRLDPVAGHGTFIAGIYQQYAPGSKIVVRKVIQPNGIGDDSGMAQAVADLMATTNTPHERTILNLSFGTYVLPEMTELTRELLLAQLAGVTVVASAGNDGLCLPSYPAALPDVVSVGALGPYGPAEFSNRGHWVRACAQGTDLLSTFFTGFDGPEEPVDGDDPDQFDGWATWTGTSFAAPMVGAAIARELNADSTLTGSAVVAGLIDDPSRPRLPLFGTVVES